ncbi:hypothetical protein LWI28_009882 [Acer negundo]|uniref:Retrovirus-related Pol polyprotein from transposon TNT 1-94 n=1 Tax=Acer negundo TaxID=4023 RepID=A0AAD5JPT8_ACENE|nr:hypothetical protein LWI28_009882 [Acer negundo]
MKQKYQGSTRVKKALLQVLQKDFEVLQMKEGKSVDEYFAQTLIIANKMKVHGESMEQVVIIEKILRSMTIRDVVFEENECWNWGRSNEEANLDVLEWGVSNEEGCEHDQSEEEAKDEVAVEEGGREVNLPSTESFGENSQTFKESSSSPEGRNKRVPFWMEDYVSGEELSEEEVEHNLVLFTSTIDPTTFEEAVQSSKWRAVIDLEIKAIERNGT